MTGGCLHNIVDVEPVRALVFLLEHDATMRRVTAYIERDPETGYFVGIVPGITGAHTQGETLDELNANLKEVLELCLAESTADLPEFVGIQEIEV